MVQNHLFCCKLRLVWLNCKNFNVISFRFFSKIFDKSLVLVQNSRDVTICRNDFFISFDSRLPNFCFEFLMSLLMTQTDSFELPYIAASVVASLRNKFQFCKLGLRIV